MSERPPRTRQSRHMHRFSTLAGPWQKLPSRQNYAVSFVDLKTYDSLLYRTWIHFAAYGSLGLVLAFEAILFFPAHWIVIQQPSSPTHTYNWVMLICLGVLQLFVIIGTYSSTRSSLKIKDPVPVRPPHALRVALTTTRAPGEPVAMVKTTLEAMRRVRYRHGTVDVWLLDETNDPELQTACKTIGAHHFSRSGVTVWNTTPVPARTGGLATLLWRWAAGKPIRQKASKHWRHNPRYAAKSKHGNFNAWMEHIQKQGLPYDILAGVDTDHVPQPNYLERTLGYFRDPDVAFVVGPQVYGNYRQGLRGLVARWAESQASFFQSTIQRAGNATMSPMFVGTNYTIRLSTLRQIGGFQPCITEDMATGLAIHKSINPKTGKRWTSVYTPDVLAVGEGPEFWGPYFTQQWRWAAGTFDTWKRVVWRSFFRLPPKTMLHYFLMLTYYPITALTWLLGIVSSLVYLTTGATAILAPWGQFVSLYLMVLVMQLSLYFWNRRYNVSPHEPEGTLGIPGMALSALAAPIYLSALRGILSGKKPHFVVTTKGSSDNPDWILTFRTHLQWAAVLTAGLAYGFVYDHTNPAMLLWVGTQLLLCLLPFCLGMAQALPERIRTSEKISLKEEPFNA